MRDRLPASAQCPKRSHGVARHQILGRISLGRLENEDIDDETPVETEDLRGVTQVAAKTS